jgi:hypothetical protein
MALSDFKKKALRLKQVLSSADARKADVQADVNSKKKVYDFKEGRKEYYKNTFTSALDDLDHSAAELNSLCDADASNPIFIQKISKLVEEIPASASKQEVIDRILDLAENIKEPEKHSFITKKNALNVPLDVKDDIFADIAELDNCFNAGCYRSVVILCGRLLETALHRKYFEVTGNDALEKNPGIGLGTLIAKLAEKNVAFDPGITNQIHLINQVRISSVHKKKEAFYPSEAQTRAMVLYTLDILDKIFRKK